MPRDGTSITSSGYNKRLCVPLAHIAQAQCRRGCGAAAICKCTSHGARGLALADLRRAMATPMLVRCMVCVSACVRTAVRKTTHARTTTPVWCDPRAGLPCIWRSSVPPQQPRAAPQHKPGGAPLDHTPRLARVLDELGRPARAHPSESECRGRMFGARLDARMCVMCHGSTCLALRRHARHPRLASPP